METLDKETIKRNIRAKYKSLTQFARVLGISKQGLDSKINTMSYTFIVTLMEHGIHPKNNELGGILQQNEAISHVTHEQHIALLTAQIKALEEVIKAKEELLELYRMRK